MQAPSGAIIVSDSADEVQPANACHSVGRRSKFRPEEDLIIVREVAASRAHIAPNSETRERFEVAAAKINGTKRVRTPVTWKSVQDRYKRLQSRFDRHDKIEAAMSGVGGDIGELEELLSSMQEARNDISRDRESKRQKLMERDAEKEQLGLEIRQMATSRRVGNIGLFSGEEETDVPGHVEGDDDGTVVTPAKQRTSGRDPFKGDIELFASVLSTSDKMRNEVDKERLRLDQQRLEMEQKDREEMRKEREIERLERRAEREENNRLELEKFKLMMAVFKDGLKSSSAAQSSEEPSKDRGDAVSP